MRSLFTPTHCQSRYHVPYAANAFNVFREALHQIELVRLSALWDQLRIDNEAIPSVIELVDNEDVINALADAARAQYAKAPEPLDKNEPAEEREIVARMMKKVNEQRGEEHAKNATAGFAKGHRRRSHDAQIRNAEIDPAICATSTLHTT